MTENTTSRDDKLLKRESYIRRERYVAFSLAAGGALGAIAEATHLISEGGFFPTLGFTLFFLVYADSCSLRLRHIQSIKFYRGTATHDKSA